MGRSVAGWTGCDASEMEGISCPAVIPRRTSKRWLPLPDSCHHGFPPLVGMTYSTEALEVALATRITRPRVTVLHLHAGTKLFRGARDDHERQFRLNGIIA
jgi:hypothetical protein